MKLNNKVEESENFGNGGFYRDIKGVTFQHWSLIGWVFLSILFPFPSNRRESRCHVPSLMIHWAFVTILIPLKLSFSSDLKDDKGWNQRESLYLKGSKAVFFTILVSFPQIGACIRGERVPALIKIYGDTVSIQRWNMAPLNIQDLSLNYSIPHHPSNRKKRKASIVYRVYTIDKSLSLKLRGDLLYHQMKRN